MLSSSQTEVVRNVESSTASANKVLVLRLKVKSNNVKWSEDTVDNEGMEKKSSKRCCIYHKPKNFGESDSDESDSDTEVAKKTGKKKDVQPFQRFHA